MPSHFAPHYSPCCTSSLLSRPAKCPPLPILSGRRFPSRFAYTDHSNQPSHLPNFAHSCRPYSLQLQAAHCSLESPSISRALSQNSFISSALAPITCLTHKKVQLDVLDYRRGLVACLTCILHFFQGPSYLLLPLHQYLFLVRDNEKACTDVKRKFRGKLLLTICSSATHIPVATPSKATSENTKQVFICHPSPLLLLFPPRHQSPAR